MKLSPGSSADWRLRDAPFALQQTYKTPLDQLPRFISTILSPFSFFEGSIWIEQIVFNPNQLIEHLSKFGVSSDESQLRNAVLYAENTSEAVILLEKVLGEWIDFAFIPSPKEFVIYADHDEYTTIFAASTKSLEIICSNMKQEGFQIVDGWMWTGPHSSL